MSKTDRAAPKSLPLKLAEHHMLQVLLPRLELERISHGPLSGVHLTVSFDEDVEAIWRRQQRRFIQEENPGFRRQAGEIDQRLRDFFDDPKATREVIEEPPFVFRYGNGGVLPVLRLGDHEYYALAFRDIPPIGWNLANGASDTRHELLNPIGTIERELREELLIVDEGRQIRYVLEWEAEHVMERPEFLIAREFWKRRRDIDIGAFEERVAPVTWIHGPDAITVKCPGQLPRTSTGLFLNISASDYGVEVDRIAKIHVEEGATLLDGETYGTSLVDRPVGLFEVERFAKAFRSEDSFLPDIVFCSGERSKGPAEESRRLIEAACRPESRPLRSPAENDAWAGCSNRFDLCPVTRQLVKRHMDQEQRVARPPDRRATPCRVFISSAGHEDDLSIAERIHGHLSVDGGLGNVFFYKEEPMSMDWLRTIEEALLDASVLIVVCTDIDRVRSLGFEWQSFFNWRRYGRKAVGEIVPVVQGLAPFELPLPLCTMDSIDMSSELALERLARKVRAVRSH